MKILSSKLIHHIQKYITLICLVMLPCTAFGIEPIATFGKQSPQEHVFLSNNTLLRYSYFSTNIQVVDRDTREVIDEFGTRTKDSDVLFSANAEHVAILDQSYSTKTTTVNIWDVIARELISEWEAPSPIYENAEFHPIQPWLVSSYTNEIYLWNWQTGELIGKMIGERRPSKECDVDLQSAINRSVGRTCSSRPDDRDYVFTPDGKHLIVASTRPDIELWNLETQELVGHYEGHVGNWVEGLAISPDGRYLASFESITNFVYLWDVVSTQLLWKLPIDDREISELLFSPNGEHLYAAHNNVYILDVKSGQRIDTFGNDYWYLDQMLLSPDGKTMLLQYGGNFLQGGVVELWDTETRQKRKVFADYSGGIPRISNDGETMVSIEGFFIKVWDVPTQQVRFVIPGVYFFEKGFAFSPDNKRIAYGKFPRTEVANIQNGDVEVHTQNFPYFLEDVTFSSSGRWLAATENFGYLFVWDLINPKIMQNAKIDYPKERHRFKKVAFSENDTYMATIATTGDHNNYKYWILVWKREGDNFDLRYRWEIPEHDDSHNQSLTFATTADGATVLAIALNAETQIWRIFPKTAQLVSTLPGADTPIHFGADSRYIFTRLGSDLQIWDWKTSRQIKFPSIPNFQGLSPNGSYLVSTDEIRRFQIWDAKDTFSTLPYSVEPKGKQLVTFGQIKRNQLMQNFPNPFNPETWIPFRLADESIVTLDIHSATGELIRSISPGTMKAGNYSGQSEAVHWDGKNNDGEPVSSGVYFYTINTDDFSATRKMIIRK